jgi:hypothetical protein
MMAQAIFNFQTGCDYNTLTEGINPLAEATFSKFSALRYRDAIYPYEVKSLGSGTPSLNGGMLKYNNGSISYKDRVIYTYSTPEGVTRPIDMSNYLAFTIDSTGLWTLDSDGNLNNYAEQVNGIFDLNTPPLSSTHYDLISLPGQVTYKITKLTHKIAAYNGSIISLNNSNPISFAINGEVEIANYIGGDGEQWLITEQKVQTRKVIIGQVPEFVDGIYQHWEQDSLILTMPQVIGQTLNPAYKLITGISDSTQVTESIEYFDLTDPLATGEVIYSYCFHPKEPFVITVDAPTTGDRVFRWRRLSGVEYFERTKIDSIVRMATDSTPSSDYNSSEITQRFNRNQIFPAINKAAILFVGGQIFGASYKGILISPLTDTATVDVISSSSGNTYFSITLSDNSKYYVAAGINIVPEISRIDADLYQLNIADPFNLISIDNKANVNIGAVDWTNRIKPEQVLAINSSIYEGNSASNISWNSAFNANYEVLREKSTSLVYGSPTAISYSPSNNNIKSPMTAYWEEIIPKEIIIDYYWNRTNSEDIDTTPEYWSSGTAYLFLNKNTKLVGLRFPEPTSETISMPSPVNSTYKINYADLAVINWGSSNYSGISNQRDTMASYYLVSSLGNDESIFWLAGTYYSYDGETIWQMAMQNYLVTDYLPAVRAPGMKFVGVSTNDAYFWSNYDNSIYTFNGSQQLNRNISIHDKGELVNGAFCQWDDRLSLLFEKGLVIFEHNLPSDFGGLFSEVQPLAVGSAYRTEEGQWYQYVPSEDGIISLETNYLGSQSDIFTVDFKNIDMRSVGNISLNIETRGRTFTKSSNKTLNAGYNKIMPPTNNANGIKLKINSSNPIYELLLDYKDNAPIAQKG